MNYSKMNIFQLILCKFNLGDGKSTWNRGSSRNLGEESVV